MYKYLLIGFILGIILTYFLIEVRTSCIIKNDARELLNDIIRKLIRQASRWSTAAEQDNSPMIAVLHASYGAGYLWALKDIASDSDIKIASNVDINKLETNITEILDRATKKAIAICPQYGPPPSFLSKLSGEGI